MSGTLTPVQLDLLRATYPEKGGRACLRFLPGRTVAQIYELAKKYGLQRNDRLTRAGVAHRRHRKKTKDNPERKMRLCLGGCGEYFESEWIGNRQCQACLGRQELAL